MTERRMDDGRMRRYWSRLSVGVASIFADNKVRRRSSNGPFWPESCGCWYTNYRLVLAKVYEEMDVSLIVKALTHRHRNQHIRWSLEGLSWLKWGGP